MSASDSHTPQAFAGLPKMTSWQWSDVLDELYAHATWLWEHDREGVADSLAEVADALASHVMIGAGEGMDDPDFDGVLPDEAE